MPSPAKIVARFKDNRILKGHTMNVDPAKPTFTLKVHGQPADKEPVVIRLEDLKAVFFVRDFEGNRQYNEKKEFVDRPTGRKLAVTFKDGEVLIGTSLTLEAGRATFFLFPADPASNNEKVLVVTSAVSEVRRLQ